MMDQKCNQETFEAVKLHPFFQGVELHTAQSLLDLCEVRSFNKTELVLKKDEPRAGLHLMLEGISEVFVRNEFNDREEVLEIIQKGEMIGLSSLADFLGVSKSLKQEVMVEVRAVDKVKALFIPFEVITRRWEDPNVHDYLLTQISIRLKDVYGSLAEQVKLARDYGENEAFMLRVQDVMTDKIIAVSPDETIQETAIKMTQSRTSSVLVIEEGNLKGIITERDMVARVVAKGISMSTKVNEIMTSQPVTINRFSYYYDAISLTLLKGIKHLPVVEESKVIGIVTLSDLLRKKNENVMKTIQKIEQADEESLPNVKKAIYEVFDTLIRDQVPILKTLDMVTKLYDRLVIRAIELSEESLRQRGLEPPVTYSFYQMGSGGRAEQFMLTDQDHFLVYEETTEEGENYFSELGKEITSHLQKAGYALCKGLMMCSEEVWRGSLHTWEERVRHWMLQSTNDNLLKSQNFFSYRFITGSIDLNQRFEITVTNLLKRSKIFLFRLAQIEREYQIPSLEQPIRSLFKLERKSIDMKKEVLFPYHHSLQILSVLNGKVSGTPLEKIDYLKSKGIFSETFTHDLREAVEQVLTLYVRQRWNQAKTGKELNSTVSFTRLTTREKEELILSLNTLKELQGQVFAQFSV
ncbi:DUF294 nucleotidyltransferase-like domain-containing protein [Bacillus sp. 31A1R]|uniref:DUF294 nucleotidyltransferase-like domain-containing protein n=1 Tax=Robertmurraya mangrovi TaxID=3098077 RepID=A0ABU5IXH4_9BACI|nr:DUF294 nucleotidyltransferase-like domain-containing protein [Bacillus sp. 31A1R]MDZ5471840.1 DUF294 nucleotidyltransferase-like domain-containing protein [Bacillus sp. 31A1R]